MRLIVARWLKDSSKKSGIGFFTLGAKLAFVNLRHTFNTTLIIYYFDGKCHIWIETNISWYAIDGILR